MVRYTCKKYRKHKLKQYGGEFVCPPGMPPKICETLKRKHSRPRISKNLKNEIKAAVTLRNFRLLPEEERIMRQQAYWKNYVNSRYALSANKNKNNNNNINGLNLNIHEYSNNNL
jgi:hypothetical protein